MKKFILTIFSALFLISACNKSPEKPKITIGDFSRQVVITKGVIDKIMQEKDFKKMHEIAIAIESSRAVNCISVGEECNIYGEVLNKIVSSTQTSMPNEADNVAIYKKISELDEAARKSQEILIEQWKVYLNSKTQEEK